jgi:hypothetical protein
MPAIITILEWFPTIVVCLLTVSEILVHWVVCDLVFLSWCRPDLEKRKAEKAELEAKRKEANLAKLRQDLAESQGQNVVLSAPRRMEEDDEEEEEEEEEIDDDDDDDDADGEEDNDEIFREIGGRLWLILKSILVCATIQDNFDNFKEVISGSSTFEWRLKSLLIHMGIPANSSAGSAVWRRRAWMALWDIDLSSFFWLKKVATF